ncbi:MAG: prepilin-type N-terminal cleavage/methylation domain-containing protein [Sedimentisphaerales bacterium]|nr:prepilin-type N-terminal cleavage/methylation domain-containing protein [Sedimentisphaerales bacterium]
MNRRREQPGLTLIEILTVIAIIALLIGILIPAVTAVKDAAKEVKQRGQFMTIELGLTAFKNDYGEYPPSTYLAPPVPPYPPRPTVGGIYLGAQRLCEALLGWDLLGFHPDSAWWWDGLDINGGPLSYDPRRVRGTATFDERKKPYLESGTQNAFKLSALLGGYFPTTLGTDTYVLCDVFGATKITLPDGSSVNAGAPILYYKANTSGKTISDVYKVADNQTLVYAKQMKDGTRHPLADPNPGLSYEFFYGNALPADAKIGYIEDSKITTRVWPYNPSSYILISAGADGIYGTSDDIRNFGD